MRFDVEIPGLVERWSLAEGYGKKEALGALQAEGDVMQSPHPLGE